MKLVVVGGVAGGASVAARVRRLNEQAEIVVFERGPHVSFSNCCLPFHLSGTIEKAEDLVLMSPAQFASQYNIDVRVNSEVVSIDPAAKTVTVECEGKTYTESYDKLALAPGAKAILPKSLVAENVFTVKNVVDIDRLKRYIDDHQVKQVAVIGAGYIGLEVVENLVEAGKEVHLIEGANQVMNTIDEDMAQILHKVLYDKGVHLHLGQTVSKIDEQGVWLEDHCIEVGASVVAIGVQPETKLAQDAGLELGQTGAIKVNQHYQTSHPDIYAVGDVVEVYSRLLGQPMRLALAGPAQRQARAAANHMMGKESRDRGVIGSSCLKLFDYNVASTGLTEKTVNVPYEVAYTIPSDRVGILPVARPMFFKLLFEVPTGRLLGATAVGQGDVTKRIDVIATLLMTSGTLDDLQDLELCYSPYFSTAKDVVNHTALVAQNLLHGAFKQVRVHEVRNLVENGATIIDVREPEEYEKGHLVNAINIPMSQFRQRLAEIPTDRPVYVHCRSSQRSYNVLMALQGLGYQNVYNISGSFLGICMYEYFKDQTSKRSPIVTAYNFD